MLGILGEQVFAHMYMHLNRPTHTYIHAYANTYYTHIHAYIHTDTHIHTHAFVWIMYVRYPGWASFHTCTKRVNDEFIYLLVSLPHPRRQTWDDGVCVTRCICLLLQQPQGTGCRASAVGCGAWWGVDVPSDSPLNLSSLAPSSLLFKYPGGCDEARGGGGGGGSTRLLGDGDVAAEQASAIILFFGL